MTQPAYLLPNAERLRRVEEAVRSGRASYPVWAWPVLGPYNGWSGERRIEVWKVQTAARRLGLLAPAHACTVCGATGCKLDMHNENYGDPFDFHLICQGNHRILHARFKRPAPWLALVRAFANDASWFAHLPMRDPAAPLPAPVAVQVPPEIVHPVAALAPIQRRFGPPLLARRVDSS